MRDASENSGFSSETREKYWLSAKAVIYSVSCLIVVFPVMIISGLNPTNYLANAFIGLGFFGCFVFWVIFIVRGVRFVKSAFKDDARRKMAQQKAESADSEGGGN